jgi:hypothetical protein
VVDEDDADYVAPRRTNQVLKQDLDLRINEPKKFILRRGTREAALNITLICHIIESICQYW